MYTAANPPPVLPDDHTIVPTMLFTPGGTRGAWGTAAGHSTIVLTSQWQVLIYRF